MEMLVFWIFVIGFVAALVCMLPRYLRGLSRPLSPARRAALMPAWVAISSLPGVSTDSPGGSQSLPSIPLIETPPASIALVLAEITYGKNGAIASLVSSPPLGLMLKAKAPTALPRAISKLARLGLIMVLANGRGGSSHLFHFGTVFDSITFWYHRLK
jgi:hypothetical protein